jgi:hypothetical protein
MTKSLAPDEFRRMVGQAVESLDSCSPTPVDHIRALGVRRRRVRGIATTVGAVIAIAGISGVAVGMTAGGTATRVSGGVATGLRTPPLGWRPSASDLAYQHRLANILPLLAAAGRGDGAYDVAVTDLYDKAVVVYRKSGLAIASYVTIASRNHVKILFAPSVLSATERQRLTGILWAARSRFEAIGTHVTSVVSGPGGPVVIGVSQVSAGAVQLAGQLTPFGTSSVVVRKVNVATLGTPSRKFP